MFFRYYFPLLCCSLGVLSIFSAMLPIVGPWGQSGTVGPVMRIVFTLNTLSLLIYMLRSDKDYTRVLAVLKTPPIFLFLAFTLWSVIAAFTHPITVRSFMGSLELNEGALLFLGVSAFAINASLLYRNKHSRKFLFYLSILVVLCVTVLQLLYQQKITFLRPPYLFPDYIAFFAILMLPIIVFWGSHIALKWRLVIAFSLASIILYISSNMSAILLSATLIPFVFLSSKIGIIKKHWNIWTATLVIAPAFFLTIIIIFTGVIAGQDETYFNHGHLQTLVSRYNMMPILWSGITQEPHYFIFGSGWGSYGDQHIAHLATDKLDLVGNDGARWEGIWRHHFHSHHVLAESLLGSGFIGLLLFCLFLIKLANGGGKYRIYMTMAIAVYTALLTQWFQLPPHYMFLAMVIAAVPTRRNAGRSFQGCKPLLVTIMATLVLVHSYSFSINYSLPSKVEKFWTYDVKDHSCSEELLSDHNMGGAAIAHTLRSFASYVLIRIPEIQKELLKHHEKRGWDGEAPELKQPEQFSSLGTDVVEKLEHILCIADNYVDNNESSVQLQMAALTVRSDIALTMLPYLPDQNADFALSDWGTRLLSFVMQYPSRTDQIAPYMLWSLSKSDEGAVLEMANAVLEIRPRSPVALWFKGIVLLNTPEYAVDGIKMMKSALDYGIERIVPVDKSIKDSLLQ